MDNDGWVTEPGAIDTLIALKEMKVGDEVRLQRVEDYGLASRYRDGQTVVVIDDSRLIGVKLSAINDEHRDRALFHQPVIAHIHEQWVICRENIAAWRRPGALKK
jgi:hypothetical protein